ncbi:hypothetical protein T31B1_19587 [Salinisphaera sp. T31B1]
MFAACGTQWRVIAGPGAVIHQGLEYTAVESVMRMRGVEDQAQCLDHIQHIERGALDELNKD